MNNRCGASLVWALHPPLFSGELLTVLGVSLGIWNASLKGMQGLCPPLTLIKIELSPILCLGMMLLASAHSWLRHGKEGLNTLCYICKQNKMGFDFHLEQSMQ